MIEANGDLFSTLDRYASDGGVPLANAGAPRWVASHEVWRKFLKEAVCSDQLRISGSMRIARFDLDDCAYIVTAGLDISGSEFSDREIEVDGAVWVAAIADMQVTPTASPYEVKNIVEAGDRDSDIGYCGHDVADVAALFPKIQCFKLGDVDQGGSPAAFLLFCLSDHRARQWMSEALHTTLRQVINLGPVDTPYATLCRSIFDHDPASLFLALYRCLDALYAWSVTRKLMRELGVEGAWMEVAQKLEASLGWRPREEQSLIGLLALAEERDLTEIVRICGGDDGASNLAERAGKNVYGLRNQLVHYRPIHRHQVRDAIDWNRLCELMAIVAFYVYSRIMGGDSPLSDAGLSGTE